jgi:hypothetical protein
MKIKMRKKLFLLSVLALLVFAMANCDDTGVNNSDDVAGTIPTDTTVKVDAGVDAELRSKIIQDYFDQFVKPIDNGVKLEDVQILKCYGNFDGVVVVRFDSPAFQVITTIQVGGVNFTFNNSNVAIVWHDGNFFELQEAYENGLLSIANLTYVAGKVNQNNDNNDNDKVPDPGGEFSYDWVQVTLTEEASILDKVWMPSDFPEFAFSEIRNIRLTDPHSENIITYPHMYLLLYLTEPSRDNVLRAIYVLVSRPEVYMATVARLGGPGGGGG